MSQDLLGAKCNRRCLTGRKTERLIVAVGMKRLTAPQNRSERLHRNANNIVQRLLCCECHARRLTVKSKSLCAIGFRTKSLFHDVAPKTPRCAKLGNLLDEVVVNIEK